MKISDILNLVDVNQSSFCNAEQTLTGLTADSRSLEKGFAFFALSGSQTDGAQYIDQAMEKGANLIVGDSGAALDDPSIPYLAFDNPRLLLAKAAAKFYGAQPETMVAVTGTAGKTSVASFVRQIWETLGQSAAMIGTTGVVAPGRNDYGSLTTPDPVKLHALLSELATSGVSHCSMEASSHGLDQFRLDGVQLSAAGFTNLGRDHMDYHPTVEHYMNAKMALFERVLPKGSPAIIFSDDAWSDYAINAAAQAGQRVLTVGASGTYLALKRVEQHRDCQRAEIHFEEKIFEVEFPLAGEFQMSNALVAAGLVISTGGDADKVFESLEKIKGAPGRLELVGKSKDGAPVYVDYAHKPDALKHVLSAVRPFTTGRVIVVFGCGGDRDKGKRALMGQVSSQLADIVIVTDDNPRTEKPQQIRSEILKAAPDALEIGDRSHAISRAVEMLQEGDTLIVAGKGHETGQLVGDKLSHFSDHEEVLKALEAAK